MYHNIDLIPDGDVSDTFNTNDDSRDTYAKDSNSSETVEVHDKAMKFIVLHEYYGQYDIDGDGYLEECIITMANGSTIIRADYNPYPGSSPSCVTHPSLFPAGSTGSPRSRLSAGFRTRWTTARTRLAITSTSFSTACSYTTATQGLTRTTSLVAPAAASR